MYFSHLMYICIYILSLNIFIILILSRLTSDRFYAFHSLFYLPLDQSNILESTLLSPVHSAYKLHKLSKMIIFYLSSNNITKLTNNSPGQRECHYQRGLWQLMEHLFSTSGRAVLRWGQSCSMVHLLCLQSLTHSAWFHCNIFVHWIVHMKLLTWYYIMIH